MPSGDEEDIPVRAKGAFRFFALRAVRGEEVTTIS